MRTRPLDELVRRSSLARGLDDAGVHFLTGCARNMRFEEGEYLCREGEPARWVFDIRDGRVALEASPPGREPVALETLSKGDAMGWSSLVPPHLWHVDARAKSRVVVLAFDAECVRRKCAEDKAFGYAVLEQLLFLVHRRLEFARLQQIDVYRNQP